jgi:hypothetical protein
VKYTIEGLSQAKLLEWGLDATDAVILRWFADFYHGSKMKALQIEGREYRWLRYQHVIDELPICGSSDRNAMASRFRKYRQCGLMSLKVWTVGGTFTYFRLVPEKWDELTSSTPVDKPVDGLVDKQEGGLSETGGGSLQNERGVSSKWETNDSSINSSINSINKREAPVDNSDFQQMLELECGADSVAYRALMGGSR